MIRYILFRVEDPDGETLLRDVVDNLNMPIITPEGNPVSVEIVADIDESDRGQGSLLHPMWTLAEAVRESYATARGFAAEEWAS